MQTVHGWWLVVRQSEMDRKPAIWATDGTQYRWVADIPDQGSVPSATHAYQDNHLYTPLH